MVEKNREVGPPQPGAPVEPHKITRTPLTQILDEMDANIRAAAEAAARAEQAAKAAKEAASQIDTIFSLEFIDRLEADRSVPMEEILKEQGVTYYPNGKFNLGLGRPLVQ